MSALLALCVVLGSASATPVLARGTAERLVYFTTFQHGLSGWEGTPEKWKVGTRFIETGPPSATVLVAPLAVRMKNYAIQSKFRVVAWRNRGPQSAFAGILFRAPGVISYQGPKDSAKQGLVAGLYQYRAGAKIAVMVKQATERSSIGTGEVPTSALGSGLHTYRVEVHGSRIDVLIDGIEVLTFSWNDSAGGTRVGLVVSRAVVQVKGFRVVRL